MFTRDITLLNGWTNYTNGGTSLYSDAICTCDDYENTTGHWERVDMGGLIVPPTGFDSSIDNQIIGQIYPDCLPDKRRIFTATTYGGVVRIDIDTAGNLIFKNLAKNQPVVNWIALDGITFITNTARG